MDTFIKEQFEKVRKYTENYSITEKKGELFDVVYSEHGRKRLVWMNVDFMDVDLILTQVLSAYEHGEADLNSRIVNRKPSSTIKNIVELKEKLDKIHAPSFCYLIGEGIKEHEKWELGKRVTGYWTVGYWERGDLNPVQCFDTEAEACSVFFEKVMSYTEDVKKHFDTYARQHMELIANKSTDFSEGLI